MTCRQPSSTFKGSEATSPDALARFPDNDTHDAATEPDGRGSGFFPGRGSCRAGSLIAVLAAFAEDPRSPRRLAETARVVSREADDVLSASTCLAAVGDAAAGSRVGLACERTAKQITDWLALVAARIAHFALSQRDARLDCALPPIVTDYAVANYDTIVSPLMEELVELCAGVASTSVGQAAFIAAVELECRVAVLRAHLGRRGADGAASISGAR